MFGLLCSFLGMLFGEFNRPLKFCSLLQINSGVSGWVGESAVISQSKTSLVYCRYVQEKGEIGVVKNIWCGSVLAYRV